MILHCGTFPHTPRLMFILGSHLAADQNYQHLHTRTNRTLGQGFSLSVRWGLRTLLENSQMLKIR